MSLERNMNNSKRYISILIILIILILTSCKTSNKNNLNIEVVYEKTIGVTGVYMCYAKTNDYDEMNKFGQTLVEDNKVAFVYFYNDKSMIKDIRNYKNLEDMLPDDGYIAKLDKSPGLGIHFEISSK